jgi:effector-binding domain-containing protein
MTGYAVQIKETPKQPVVTVRRHTTFDKLGETMTESMRAILGCVEPKGAWPTGAPFAIYHNAPFRPDDVDVEFGVPLSDTCTAVGTSAEIAASELPPGSVAFAVHEGPYEEISAAYAALDDWLRKSGRHLAGPPREIYLVGPNQTGDPAEYRTEIDVPLQ